MTDTGPTTDGSLARHFQAHPRDRLNTTYVYPVISRRSRGLSLGINLSPTAACSFDCVYCQVDRSHPEAFPASADVDLGLLDAELHQLLGMVTRGDLWRLPDFRDVRPEYRVLRDIAFSGNGEPTSNPAFPAAVDRVIAARHEFGLISVKVVVITNATLLHRPAVEQALSRLDPHGGEVWAKLDAGTDLYYQQVNRSRVPLDKVLDNILHCGQVRPIVIQTLLMALHGEPMPDAEFTSYLDRLAALVRGGCRIDRVQLYTIARQTAEDWVTPLTPEQPGRYAGRFRERFPQLPVESYPGT